LQPISFKSDRLSGQEIPLLIPTREQCNLPSVSKVVHGVQFIIDLDWYPRQGGNDEIHRWFSSGRSEK
jgi:hypothetical protein